MVTKHLKISAILITWSAIRNANGKIGVFAVKLRRTHGISPSTVDGTPTILIVVSLPPDDRLTAWEDVATLVAQQIKMGSWVLDGYGQFSDGSWIIDARCNY